MEKVNGWRFVRRLLLLTVVLILLVACSVQVRAVLPGEEAGLTKENFASVAVQLEAVARAEGRSIADRMMHNALSGAMSRTASAAAFETQTDGTLNVIVVPESRPALSVEQWLLIAFGLFAAGILAVSVCRQVKKQRSVVYKPMRTVPVQRSYYADYGTARTYR